MILAILITLFVILLINDITIVGLPSLDITVATINRQAISLWDIITFVLVAGLIGLLPRPFREIFAVVLLVWTLSVLGIIAIGGLSTILLFGILIGTLAYLVTNFRKGTPLHHHDEQYVDRRL